MNALIILKTNEQKKISQTSGRTGTTTNYD